MPLRNEAEAGAMDAFVGRVKEIDAVWYGNRFLPTIWLRNVVFGTPYEVTRYSRRRNTQSSDVQEKKRTLCRFCHPLPTLAEPAGTATCGLPGRTLAKQLPPTLDAARFKSRPLGRKYFPMPSASIMVRGLTHSPFPG